MVTICVRFIHDEGFSEDWGDLGLNDDDLRALELDILLRPKASPLSPTRAG